MRDTPFGPDFLSRITTRIQETDPVILEVQSLEDKTKKAVMTAPGKSFKIDGETITLDDAQYQEYQRLSGEWIVNDLRNEMQQEGWATLTDEEKIKLIKDIQEAQRKYAREELFSPQQYLS